MKISQITTEEVAEIYSDQASDRLAGYPNIKLRPNVEPLRKVKDWVVEQRELDASDREWRQSSWFALPGGADLADLGEQFREFRQNGELNVCNTHACIAGHVATMYGEPLATLEGSLMDMVRADDDGKVYRMPNLAARKLGLSQPHASYLFAAEARASDVLSHLDRMIEYGEKLNAREA